MSRKIYIGEDNLINLKNAMAGKNIGHSTFMQEDKPPYEKDEFTINPEGGANDNFHVNENISKEFIKTAIKYKFFKITSLVKTTFLFKFLFLLEKSCIFAKSIAIKPKSE